MNIRKKSLIAGALTSSAAIFISKTLGLLYIVPFTAMAGEVNSRFYGAAYTFYDTLLNISAAGIPFAVAAMVAKYAEHKDFKTVVFIRKISMSIMLLSGFVIAVIFAGFSGPLAQLSAGSKASVGDVAILKNTFMIVSLALVFVPFLSSFRGFYQGLKELNSYAFSQVLEQIARVTLLLGLGAICVYLLKLDGIWAVYMAVFSTSLAAIVAIVYYFFFDRKHYGTIKELAQQQSTEPKDRKFIMKELFYFGIPYVIIAILGNSMSIVNTTFFNTAMSSSSMGKEQIDLIYGMIQVQTNKLTSIPQVLALGFSASIVPYVTISLEKRNFKELRKNILDCLDTVLYLALPLCFCLLALSKPIYYVMFGGENYILGAEVLSWASLLALTGTFSPVCSSLMMSLRFRRQSILILLIGFAVKLITFFPLVHYTGYSGAITSSVLTSVVIVFLNLSLIRKKYNLHFRQTFKRLLVMLFALVCMNGSFVLLRWLGLDVLHSGRIVALLQLAVYGVVGLGVYFIVTSSLQLPQVIFNININQITKKFFRRK